MKTRIDFDLTILGVGEFPDIYDFRFRMPRRMPDIPGGYASADQRGDINSIRTYLRAFYRNLYM